VEHVQPRERHFGRSAPGRHHEAADPTSERTTTPNDKEPTSLTSPQTENRSSHCVPAWVFAVPRRGKFTEPKRQFQDWTALGSELTCGSAAKAPFSRPSERQLLVPGHGCLARAEKVRNPPFRSDVAHGPNRTLAASQGAALRLSHCCRSCSAQHFHQGNDRVADEAPLWRLPELQWAGFSSRRRSIDRDSGPDIARKCFQHFCLCAQTA
jgi:hypothetical protein